MIPAAVVFLYLAAVLTIGLVARRASARQANAEDFFLAGRSLGPAVFLLSLFGANMTAFSILGASGHAFANGIVSYGLMASSSALVIPLGLFVIGTRSWALGTRHGFMTPVQMFRDRWECRHTGTVIFAVQAALLVPDIVIAVIGAGMGGFRQAVESMLASPTTAPLLTRERVSPLYFFSYTFIPLSSIAFPHIGIFCLTAKRLSHFKKTVVLYPIGMLAIWLPSVFLGVVANTATDEPAIRTKVEARATLAADGPTLTPERRDRLRPEASGDDVVLALVQGYAPLWLTRCSARP
jgi:Na+/proline symporter